MIAASAGHFFTWLTPGEMVNAALLIAVIIGQARIRRMIERIGRDDN